MPGRRQEAGRSFQWRGSSLSHTPYKPLCNSTLLLFSDPPSEREDTETGSLLLISNDYWWCLFLQVNIPREHKIAKEIIWNKEKD